MIVGYYILVVFYIFKTWSLLIEYSLSVFLISDNKLNKKLIPDKSDSELSYWIIFPNFVYASSNRPVQVDILIS